MTIAYRDAATDLFADKVVTREGGAAYKVDTWTRLRRFLILGSESGTFYVGVGELTRENALFILECVKEDPVRTVREIVLVSQAGIAPKNEPAIFALAIVSCCTDETARKLALTSLSSVCRTATHLFHFLEYCKPLRGWGRQYKRAIANWYQTMPVDDLAFQMVKYRSRDGWSHRDVLRLTKPKTEDDRRNMVYEWATSTAFGIDVPRIIFGYEQVSAAKDAATVAHLVSEFRLPREAVPSQFASDPMVQAALLTHMPMTAMIRNLGNMSKSGLLVQGSDATRHVMAKLRDEQGLLRARVHPMGVLIALKTYASGGGWRSDSSWTPVPQIIDALDDAFYLSFGAVPMVDKNIVVGIDVSSSMLGSSIANTNLTAAEMAATMAMVTVRSASNYAIIGYTSNPREITITPRMRMDDVLRAISFGGGATRCSVPAKWAYKVYPQADAVINYTDSDTSDQDTYPALLGLRQKAGKNVLGIVVAATAHGYSVYPDTDAKVLQVCGFDASVPAVMADFIATA